MPAVTGSPGPPTSMRELRELHSQMFDKASAYTKLILGLGYGGFFAAWSGGKANLRPLELMSSALLMLLSLILFIGFEMYEAFFLSTRNLAFAKALSSQSDVLGAIERLKTDEAKSVNAYVRVWKFIFWPSAITGILGA